MSEKRMTFEQSMARLSDIVKSLERGDAPLSDSLALFEEGAGLVKACQKSLEDAEQRVVKLRKGADGEPEETPFTDSEQ